MVDAPKERGSGAPDSAPPPRGEVTQLLRGLRGEGADPEAASRLFSLLYDELRARARGAMRRERTGHTLQPTALVHEAWFRLMDPDEPPWTDRAHFLAIAARVMRRVLVEHARARGTTKRGGGSERVSLHEDLDAPTPALEVETLDLHDALERLDALSPRQAKVVEMRYFGGLTIAETAEVLGVGTTTVEDDWALAKGWLHRELRGA